MYYERVTNPISLNDIKSRLMSDTYTSSIEVINDLKRVFSNAISYYHVSILNIRKLPLLFTCQGSPKNMFFIFCKFRIIFKLLYI